jgi:hypothetical protein
LVTLFFLFISAGNYSFVIESNTEESYFTLHTFVYFFKINITMSTDIKSSYWYCDKCNRSLSHGEFRYNCTICDNFDYCEHCATTVDPPHPHRMMRELAFGLEERTECAKIDMATGIRAAIAMYWDRHCLGTRDVDKHDPSIYTDTYS